MKTFLQLLAGLVLMAVCLAAGLWIGPKVGPLYQRWFPEPAFTVGDYSALYKETAKPVVAFTTSTCPACKRARELFAEHKVDYYDFVIDQSPKASEHYQTLGEQAVPVLLIGDRKIVGANEAAILEALGRLPR